MPKIERVKAHPSTLGSSHVSFSAAVKGSGTGFSTSDLWLVYTFLSF
jgi:hypothetical protein